MCLALEAWSLNHWTAREIPTLFLKWLIGRFGCGSEGFLLFISLFKILVSGQSFTHEVNKFLP